MVDFSDPHIIELRACEDGYVRWHLSTREGWEVNGCADGVTLMMKASHFAVGTRIEVREPLPDVENAAQSKEPKE